ncbi:hypothetical protein CO115_02210 [Candidatus Falkowbacteria bacterium CG_4_9_14_3_um_filter_36_9]|nr:MAG: hypothetical protein COZ73_04565 [Candidatus Falkowbacteria bacterium CG_4_8_14_3_um_filter_36_11]PJA11319.1 MAG: hypothetical protein COX67_00395 [Candidatus Falkowbacteria bacterium CG_4_10_14_0_2_um_filter_36_22]PJB19797.1 MAG: hypothetical protein CO115_02210 [Candidatus Falkowbacteria bacterium CG_4_9_14_3_um_filter_36_9]
MDKDNKVFLGHIIDCIVNIEDYTKNFTANDFSNNRMIVDAVIRNLEIIGEAARNLADNFKSVNSHIPWRDIAGLRNILIHEYFGVDKEKVWKVIQKDLPSFKKEIELLLK